MIPAIALISAIAQLAPSITSIFGGGEKSQAVAETAAEIARKVTGSSTNDEALEALKADPNKLVEYQRALLDQQTRFEELRTADRKDARDRDVEIIKAGKHNYRADFLVGMTVVIIMIIIAIVVWSGDLDEFAKGSLTTILGVFLNQLVSVFAFEFGTTRKSEESTAKITNEFIKS